MTVWNVGLLENHCTWSWRQSSNCRDHSSVTIFLNLKALGVIDSDKHITVRLVLIKNGSKLSIARYQNSDDSQLLNLRWSEPLVYRFVFSNLLIDLNSLLVLKEVKMKWNFPLLNNSDYHQKGKCVQNLRLGRKKNSISDKTFVQ